jgi:hypothetical protein
MTAKGPLELLVVGFPGEGLPTGAGFALGRIHEGGDVRIVEAILIMKSESGLVRSEEVTDVVGLATVAADDDLTGPGTNLIDAEGVAEVSEAMDNDSTALALVLEHPWARDVVSDFQGVGGVVLASTRMPEAGRAPNGRPIAGTNA